ncbi:MAG: ATP-binding protein, partial [Bacteroidota bacterium]
QRSSRLIIFAGLILISILGVLYFVIRPLFNRIDKNNRILRENQTLIASKNQQLEHFAYITSHDLKEPLRTITSFIKLFQTEFGHTIEDKAKEYCHFVSDAAHRMEKMVHSILSYAQLGESAPCTTTDLNQTIDAIMNDLKALIEQNQAQIHRVQLPSIQANETEIRMVFQNLISNAIKFRTPDTNPVIHIACEDQTDHWEFSVADNGIGMPKAKLHKIFNFFTRLHPASKYEGQGIGLAFCKKIIELHGGQITAESELGKGSIFRFTIAKNLSQANEAA